MKLQRILRRPLEGSLIAWFLMASGTLLAQVPASPPQQLETGVTELNLKIAFAFPGAEVAAPIYLTPGYGLQVGSLQFDVRFSNPSLSFTRLDLASRRLQPIANISTATWERGDPSVVSIEISNEGNNKALPDGPIGWLMFELSSEAQPQETMFTLENVRVRTVSGEQALRVRSSGSTVTILDPTSDTLAIACFFYMH